MRTLLAAAALVAASVAFAQDATRISSGAASVEPLMERGAIVGFRLQAGGKDVAMVMFGSPGNIRAGKVQVVKEKDRQSLVFGPLTAEPTPTLGAGSQVAVTLCQGDPYPEVAFTLKLIRFDQKAWEGLAGAVPFHFLSCRLPGAEIFHQRGWPIPTPVVDQYVQMQAEAPGKTVVSMWSKDWMYAPPIGAYPVPAVGLWKPSAKTYVGYDFHEARLTDHSEKLVGTTYCWKLKDTGEFFTLVWPYAKGYNELRYPADGDVVGSHFRLLYSLSMAGDDDPTRFVIENAWRRHADLLPDAPKVNDVSWYPANIRLADFPKPGLGPLYGTAGADAIWEQPGAVTAWGVGYTTSPIAWAFRQRNEAALARLRQDLDYLMTHATKQTIEGDECVFWPKPIIGEMARMFGPGVGTIHTVQGWGVAQAFLDTYRGDPAGQARLLPYIDGALRFTRHILYTRNDYADVPAAQFAWGAAPVAHFCLSYYYTFRQDPARRALCDLALKLARNMTYRYLAIWTSDNDEMDDLDASYFMEPNSGLPWLGSACANEVWVVPHALAEVYVTTGDPILGQYLRGMVERWPVLARDEYHPTMADQGNGYSERYGLFQDCPQGKGTRAAYGGIWGGFEELSWPVGSAKVHVLCGEKGAMAFDRGGVHTDLAHFSAGADGSFSFELVPAGSEGARIGEMDVVVTAPFFDLREKAVSRLRGGQTARLQPGAGYQTYDQRPDSVLIRGLQHGDTVIIGSPPAGAGVSCDIAKPRTLPQGATAKVGEFTLVNLAPLAKEPLPHNWDDPASFAGFPGGRRVIFGVPFDLIDPDLNSGAAGARSGDIPVKAAGKELLILAGQSGKSAKIAVKLAGGKVTTIDANAGVPVLTGWPPLFEWHIDLLQIPVQGTVESVSPTNTTIFAVTVAGERADLRETIASLAEKTRVAEARRRTVAGMAALKPLFGFYAGHIAVLPVPPPAATEFSFLPRLLHEAKIDGALTFLSPEQLVDEGFLNAHRFWIALYVGGEEYYNTVRTAGDGVQAIRRFLHGGGTLLALPQGPFPFYYNEANKPQLAAAQVGLPVCGSGAEGRPDQLDEALRRRIAGWEKPPADRTLTFKVNPEQKVLTSLPASFPFPQTGDPRWRPIANIVGQGNVYTPLITLYDEQGQSYGEGAATIEYKTGDLAGGRVAYVWSTLLADPQYQTGIYTDLFRSVLETLVPPPAAGVCFRAQSPIKVDGKLDEPAWQAVAPLGPFSCFGTKKGFPTYPTTAKVLWDDENLYVGFEAVDEDIWSQLTQRDAPLFEGEVLEVYADPDGDGRNYAEIEVNPLGAVLDLLIEREEKGAVPDWKPFALWNAEGLQTQVTVAGDAANRKDQDKGWTVEMAIPLKDFRGAAHVPPKIGDTWRVQLYRIERGARLAQPEFSGWSPTDTFHRPKQFGALTFAGSPTADDFSGYANGSHGSPVWHTTAGEWQVTDGAFRGRDCVVGGWLPAGAAMGQSDWRDYTLSLRFRVVSRGSDWRDGPWIGFRYTGPGSGYSFDFSGRNVTLNKASAGRSNGDADPLADVPWAPDDRWHQLEIKVVGASIAATIDGKPLLSATDQDYLGVAPVPSGGICLCARRWENSQGHTEVLFDDVRVTPVE